MSPRDYLGAFTPSDYPTENRLVQSARALMEGIRSALRILVHKNEESETEESETEELRDRLAVLLQYSQELVEYAGIGIIIDDADGKILYMNETLRTLLGYSQKEFEGRSILEFIHPDDRERVTNIHNARVNGEQAIESYECRFVTKDGGILWLEVHARKKLYGEPGTRSFLIDRTNERIAEQKIIRILETPSVCAGCKTLKIVSANGDIKWVPIDEYLHETVNGNVSHGMCPSCMQEYYPEFSDQINSESNEE